VSVRPAGMGIPMLGYIPRCMYTYVYSPLGRPPGKPMCILRGIPMVVWYVDRDTPLTADDNTDGYTYGIPIVDLMVDL